MIEFNDFNIVAILIAWVFSVAFGAFWYSPVGFGKVWSKLSGVDMTKMPKNEENTALLFIAVSALLQAVILSVVLNSLNVETIENALFAALVLWFGFTAMTTIGNTLYQRLSIQFWLLNASFFLVTMLVNAFILTIL